MDNEVDPVDELIKKTGCMEFHEKVQFCAAEHRDWRKCSEELKEFRQCMDKYYERKRSQETTEKR